MKISEKNKGFMQNVVAVTRLIPKGRVTSYGAIAKYLGSSKSARMVGWALNKYGEDRTVPAHRVVNRVGMLTGKMNFSSPTEMEERLKQEGVMVRNDLIENFKERLWDPNLELH